jgi:hypothetical protein
MPNPPHEILHHIFREDSRLFSRVLRFVEVSFPEPQEISLGNGDVTEARKVLERRIDTVLEAQTEDGPFLIAIEAQNKRDSLKLRNWAYYPAYLHERRGCPVILIVVCRDLITAAWAREPYRIGLPDRPTLVSTPIVVGPDNLPCITDPEQVIADPYFAALCALAYARDPDIGGILEALASALPRLEDSFARQLFELIERGLEDTPAQETWRKVVSYVPLELLPRSKWAQENIAKGRAEGIAEGRAEGIAEGIAESVLHILDRRHIELPAAAREQITTCTDLDRVKAWLDEALTVAAYTELTGLDDA